MRFYFKNYLILAKPILNEVYFNINLICINMIIIIDERDECE